MKFLDKRYPPGGVSPIKMHAVELRTGPRFGGFKVKKGPSSKLKLVQVFFH